MHLKWGRSKPTFHRSSCPRGCSTNMASRLIIASLLLSASSFVLPRAADDETVTLKALKKAPNGHNVVDASFQSYSIEFNYMLDFVGNNS